MAVDYSSKEYLDKVDAWWRAANYISSWPNFMKDNTLLKREIRPEDVKGNLLGIGVLYLRVILSMLI